MAVKPCFPDLAPAPTRQVDASGDPPSGSAERAADPASRPTRPRFPVLAVVGCGLLGIALVVILVLIGGSAATSGPGATGPLPGGMQPVNSAVGAIAVVFTIAIAVASAVVALRLVLPRAEGSTEEPSADGPHTDSPDTDGPERDARAHDGTTRDSAD